MVYAGTVTVTKVAKNVLKILAADFDANAESTIIDLSTYRMEGAQDFTMQVQRTAGATDVVSVSLKAANDGSNFTTILTETSHVGWGAVTGKACHSVNIFITTVGAANTLDVYVYCTMR